MIGEETNGIKMDESGSAFSAMNVNRIFIS